MKNEKEGLDSRWRGNDKKGGNDNGPVHCGFVAIIGRPNVGKSTLVNAIVGQKISITSRKAQTTRHRILGIKTVGAVQAIYVDTPGIHLEEPRVLNRTINRIAKQAIHEVDVIIFMIEGVRWTEQDERVLKALTHATCPIILAINKVDLLKEKRKLLLFIAEISQKRAFAEIIPMAAMKGVQVDILEQAIFKYLPESEFQFPETAITNRSSEFLAAEVIREKILDLVHEEVPYRAAVTLESMELQGQVWHVNAIIWVERAGQKLIILGKKGEKLKEIGTCARMELERLWGKKVYLGLWLKIKGDWTDDALAIKRFGIE